MIYATYGASMPSPPGRKPIQVTDPVHKALASLAAEMSGDLGRAVTFSEVIERLLDSYKAFAR